MNQTDVTVLMFLAAFDTFLFAWVVVKVIGYLDWKRAWRENNNVRR